MDWSNRFTLGGFTVTYCTFRQRWEVIKEKDGMEGACHVFPTEEKAQAFGLRLISGRFYYLCPFYQQNESYLNHETS